MQKNVFWSTTYISCLANRNHPRTIFFKLNSRHWLLSHGHIKKAGADRDVPQQEKHITGRDFYCPARLFLQPTSSIFKFDTCSKCSWAQAVSSWPTPWWPFNHFSRISPCFATNSASSTPTLLILFLIKGYALLHGVDFLFMLLAVPSISETSLQLMDHDYEKFFLYWQSIASAIKVMKGRNLKAIDEDEADAADD